MIILDHASPEEEKEDFTEKMAKKKKKEKKGTVGGAKYVSLFQNFTCSQPSDPFCFLGRISSIF